MIGDRGHNAGGMFTRAVLSLMALSSLAMPRLQTTPSAVENELRGLTQELLDAVAPGRVEGWRRLLHDQVIHVDRREGHDIAWRKVR